LSACQLGITMASLGLGWVGEPAFARLLEPLLHAMGVESEQALHATAFVIAFSTITALHLVIGEQAPKIFAIRRPEQMLLWCAVPLAAFYFMAYPLLAALNWTTSILLRMVGVSSTGHDVPHSEDEILALVSQAHVHGELTPDEHKLISAVFQFDDLICRRVMVPRSEVVSLDVSMPLEQCEQIVRDTRHSRFPVCNGSLDDVVGVLHTKDLIGAKPEDFDIAALSRTPHHVPETIPVSRLLQHFQQTHQLMALVDDEHGTVIGVVTLENVLEPIVGAVRDEFDNEHHPIVKDGKGFLVLGGTPLHMVNDQIGTALDARDVDTVSGLLTEVAGRTLEVGDQVQLDGVQAEVLEVDGTRAVRVRMTPLAAEQR
jgi:CBS domain containing-hemolysin-like protein